MTAHPYILPVALVVLCAVLAGCVITPVAPLTERDHGYAQSDDEKRLLRRAEIFEKELRDKGLVLDDDTVTTYVRGVGQRLVPSAAATAVPVRIHVIRDPVVNAFALPNGGIYLTVGMLARLETEAQLAHVLGHEIAHVVQRHALQQQRSRKATIIAAHIADLALFGTSIAYLPALGALASYSQEGESEADRLAIDYLTRGGYSLDDAEQLFRVLQEVKPHESIMGSVYSSHPDNAQRAKDTQAILATRAGRTDIKGRIGAEEYRAVRNHVVLENMRLKLNVRQYELTAQYAEKALTQTSVTPWLHYYRGEAYRLMAEDPAGAAREHAWIHDKKYNDELVETFRKKRATQLETAREAYLRALTADRGFVVARRGLGLVAYAQGNVATARQELNYYLTNGREISDRLYINTILGRMKP